ETGEAAAAALAALERLPENQRQALILTKVHGRSHAEAAQIAGTTPGGGDQAARPSRLRDAATAAGKAGGEEDRMKARDFDQPGDPHTDRALGRGLEVAGAPPPAADLLAAVGRMTPV